MKKLLFAAFATAALLAGAAAGSATASPATTGPAPQARVAMTRIYGPYRTRAQAEYVADYWEDRGYYAYVFYRNGYWYVSVS